MDRHVEFLACDSMGVRSFSFKVETREGLIVVDPGAALGPSRYGLPPHPIEVSKLEEKLDLIRGKLAEADYVVITHYHYDHFMRGEDVELYQGKTVFLKHPKKKINRSQAIRSYNLIKRDGLENVANTVYADSREIKLGGKVKLVFSKPVWHGEPGTKVGYVVMVLIETEDYRIAYTSDVQGPAYDEPFEILRGWRPNMLILGGPPTYLSGTKVNSSAVEAGIDYMKKLSRMPGLEVLVVDHHLLRELDYERHLKGMGVKPVTCAEFNGERVNQLEANRRLLWGK